MHENRRDNYSWRWKATNGHMQRTPAGGCRTRTRPSHINNTASGGGAGETQPNQTKVTKRRLHCTEKKTATRAHPTHTRLPRGESRARSLPSVSSSSSTPSLPCHPRLASPPPIPAAPWCLRRARSRATTTAMAADSGKGTRLVALDCSGSCPIRVSSPIVR